MGDAYLTGKVPSWWEGPQQSEELTCSEQEYFILGLTFALCFPHLLAILAASFVIPLFQETNATLLKSPWELKGRI